MSTSFGPVDGFLDSPILRVSLRLGSGSAEVSVAARFLEIGFLGSEAFRLSLTGGGGEEALPAFRVILTMALRDGI